MNMKQKQFTSLRSSIQEEYGQIQTLCDIIKAAQVLLEIDKPIFEIFSNLGVMKLRTCMLLFASISDEPVFKQVLRKYGWK